MFLCVVLALLLTGCKAGNTVSRTTSKAGDVVSKAGEDLSKAESRMESDGRTESDRDTSDYDSSRVDPDSGDSSVFDPDDISGLEEFSEWTPSDSSANDTSSDLS